MSVRKVELDTSLDWSMIPWRKLTGAVIWLIGTNFTRSVAVLVMPAAWLAWVVAVIVQAGLTQLQSPLWRRYAYSELDRQWRKRPLGMVNLGALVVDCLLNLGGVWMFLRTAHQWPPVVAVAEMFGLGTLAPLSGVWALLLCAVISAGICAAPEMLWGDE